MQEDFSKDANFLGGAARPFGFRFHQGWPSKNNEITDAAWSASRRAHLLCPILRISRETKRGTERSEIELSEAKAPQGDRRRAGSNAEGAEKDAERTILSYRLPTSD